MVICVQNLILGLMEVNLFPAKTARLSPLMARAPEGIDLRLS